MANPTSITAPPHAPTARRGRRLQPTFAERGLPDPRPVTDFTVTLTTVGGKSRLIVNLGQPCVIKSPVWPLIDCTAGALVFPASVTVVSNTQFYMDYGGLLGPMVAFVQVPFQDPQVQNPMGGYARPGGQWFRMPVSS